MTFLGIGSDSAARVEALQQRVADAEFAIQRERGRTRAMGIAWHEAMLTVTHLNVALRRKNRRIERLKELLKTQRLAAQAEGSPHQAPTEAK